MSDKFFGIAIAAICTAEIVFFISITRLADASTMFA